MDILRLEKLKTIFFLLCVSLFLPVLQAQSYVEYIDRATRCEQQDSLEQAEEYYMQAVRLQPKSPQNALLYANVARLQRLQNRMDDALTSYGYSLNRYPNNVKVLLDRAELLLEMGRERGALIDCSTVLDIDSVNRNALLMRSYLYYKARRYQEAEVDYLRLLRKNETDSVASMGLAVLYQAWEKLPKAFEIWNRLIERSPQDGMLYLCRAEVERMMKSYELALMDVDKAISLSVADADTWILRGDICMEMGKKSQAYESYQQAIQKGKTAIELKDRLKKSR